jgi:hypothetical protein
MAYTLQMQMVDKMADALQTRTADKMADTLQTQMADKTVYTSRMPKADRKAGKFGTLGNTLHRRKPVDKTGAQGGRLHTHKADNGTADSTRSHSRGDGTLRNRKRRSHRN